MALSDDPPASFVDEPMPPEAPGRPTAVPNDVGAGQPPPLAPTASVAVQAERRRIAQALHDTVSQTLTGTYLLALVTARKLQANHPESAGEVTRLSETLHRAVVELQEVTRSLQPEAERPAD